LGHGVVLLLEQSCHFFKLSSSVIIFVIMMMIVMIRPIRDWIPLPRPNSEKMLYSATLKCTLFLLIYCPHCSASGPLASCLTNAQPLPAHRPATDDNSLIGCTSHNDDWSLVSTRFIDSQYEFRCAFGCVLLLNQIYLTTVYHSTIPLRFIWSVCPGN